MSERIVDAVRSRYGATALSGLSSEQIGVRGVAEAFGYTPEELSSIPAEANMGLSCGNPTATANLREGEIVVDLGSGGGLDVFLAAQKVGPSGRAIGIDMTPEMVDLARRNAARRLAEGAPDNVEFHLATIDQLPIESNTVDCIISNCVINLAPDKPGVFREMARALKPGGRVAISDIALKKPLPVELESDVLAYVSCIAGAISIDEYKDELQKAGFAGVEVVDSRADLGAYAMIEGQSACCSPEPVKIEFQSSDASQCCSPEAAKSEASCCSPEPAKSETACCSPEPVETERQSSDSYSCCAPEVVAKDESELHSKLADLLRKYNVNDYVASVKVFAVKGE